MATKKKYYVPELKAREIYKLIIERPDYIESRAKRKQLIDLYVTKFQRCERTIRTYLYSVLPEFWTEIRKQNQRTKQRILRNRRKN